MTTWRLSDRPGLNRVGHHWPLGWTNQQRGHHPGTAASPAYSRSARGQPDRCAAGAWLQPRAADDGERQRRRPLAAAARRSRGEEAGRARQSARDVKAARPSLTHGDPATEVHSAPEAVNLLETSGAQHLDVPLRRYRHEHALQRQPLAVDLLLRVVRRAPTPARPTAACRARRRTRSAHAPPRTAPVTALRRGPRRWMLDMVAHPLRLESERHPANGTAIPTGASSHAHAHSHLC